MFKTMVIAVSALLISTGSAYAQSNGCTFPGSGWGVSGTPGERRFSGTVPGGGATGSVFPGGSCAGVPRSRLRNR